MDSHREILVDALLMKDLVPSQVLVIHTYRLRKIFALHLSCNHQDDILHHNSDKVAKGHPGKEVLLRYLSRWRE